MKEECRLEGEGTTRGRKREGKKMAGRSCGPIIAGSLPLGKQHCDTKGVGKGEVFLRLGYG